MLDLVKTLLGYVLPVVFIALIIYVGWRLNRRNQGSAEGLSSDRQTDEPDLEIELRDEVSEVEKPLEDAKKNDSSETVGADEPVLDESLGNVVDELRHAFEAAQPIVDSPQHEEATDDSSTLTAGAPVSGTTDDAAEAALISDPESDLTDDEEDLHEDDEIVVLDATDTEQDFEPSVLDADLLDEATRLQQAADDEMVGQADEPADVDQPIPADVEDQAIAADEVVAADQADMPDESATQDVTGKPAAGGAGKSSIPPRRSSSPMPSVASKKTPPKQSPEDLLARSIPPRRPKPVVTPTTARPVADIPPTGSAIPQPRILDSTIPPQRPVTPSDSADDAEVEEELAELRLALEASYHELSHLTASRDQALAQANRHEAETQNLQQRIDGVLAEQTQLQQDRAALQNLVDDLKQGTSSLQAELDDARRHAEAAQIRLDQAPPAEAIEQLQTRHNAAMDELRSILGQREANEASLRRERDSLAEVNAELERRLEKLAVDGESADDGPAEAVVQPLIDASAMAESANQIAELETQVRQLNADLSLANESIRQLNQNLSMRDSQLHGLRQEKQQLERELEAEREQASSAPPANLKDTDEFKSALNAAMSSLESDRDRVASALEATESELAAVSSVHDETTRRLQQLEQDRQQERELAVEELQQVRNTAESERGELQERLATMQSELSDVDGQRDELRQRLAQVETELGTTNAALQTAQQELLAREQDDTTEQQLALLQGSLSDANSERDQARVQVEALQSEVDSLQAKLGETQQSIESIQQDHQQRQLEDERRQQDAVGQVASMKSDLEFAKDELLTSRAELSTALDGLTAANAELQLVKSELQAANAELSETQQQHDELLKATEAQLDEIRLSLKDASADGESAKHQLADAQRELAAVHQDKAALADEISSLRTDLAERHNVAGETHGRVAALEAQVVELEQNQAAQLQELNGLRDELAQQEQLREELQAEKQVAQDQLGAFQEEINFKAGEMRRLLEQLAASEKLSHDLQEKASEVEAARQRTAELTAALEGASGELKRLQLEQIDAKHELALLADASDAWDAERLHLFGRLGLDENGQPLDPEADNSGGQDIDALREQLAEARQAADQARATAAVQQSEFDVLQEKYRERGDALESLTSQNREYRRSVANLHAVANELEELKLERVREQESARQRLQEAVAANADLSGDLAAARKDLADLTEQLAAASSSSRKSTKRSSVSKKSTATKKAAKPATRKKSAAKSTTKATTKSTTKANKTDEVFYDEPPESVDDLKQLAGVGPAIEKRLNGAGIYQFQQIANWSSETAERLTKELSLGVRVKRDRWVSQAQKLAKKSK